MNQELSLLATELGIDAQQHEPLRLAFGLACVRRVQHLLEDPRATDALAVLEALVAGRSARPALVQAAAEIAAVANSHRGSGSIDGSAHAAVSATYAVANALVGRALEAASYAAYASVYAYGGYAINDPSSFEAEHAWQVEALKALAQGDRVDTDLDGMTRDQLVAEVKKLRDGIRAHRDSTGHALCWHQPDLWGLLPERSDPLPVVPEWPQFLRGCLRYRESLDTQLPQAPRSDEPYRD